MFRPYFNQVSLSVTIDISFKGQESFVHFLSLFRKLFVMGLSRPLFPLHLPFQYPPLTANKNASAWIRIERI